MDKKLDAGEAAPDFELPTDDGAVSLASLRGKIVILYFYPKDDTSGCTSEAVAFEALRGEFNAAGVEVIGVSPDSAASHAKFRAKHSLSFALAADEARSAIEAYGVWREKSMYGRKFMGVERTTFLIDPKGRIARIWRKVRVPGHAAEALAAVKAMQELVCERLTLIMCNHARSPMFGTGACALMSRDSGPRPRPARALYYLSHARGDAIRTVALHPIAFWAIVAMLPLSLLWAGAATFYVAFHDDVLRVLASRQTEMQASYEDRLAQAHAEFDRLANRQRLDESALDGKVHELLSRQAQLERRGSVVAALASQSVGSAAVAGRPRGASAANAAGSALSAIGAASPLAAPVGLAPAAQAFAPLEPGAPAIEPKPRPLDESGEHVSAIPKAENGDSADLVAAAADPALRASAGLSLTAYSLDRMERRQTAALGEISAAARRDAGRLQGVVEKAGLAADTLNPPPVKGGVGGPYVPADSDTSADRALADAEHAVALDDRLTRLMPILPVRAPLIGEAEVSSRFGFRPDPFLGRPALHPGLDFVQGYGAEIHATAAGRVSHAGSMGGYGNMVEIDHGNNLVTRYAHMSEILVEEGQEVKAGAIIGRLGSTGRSTGAHLHYEVRVDGEPVDPERFLQAGAPLLASR